MDQVIAQLGNMQQLRAILTAGNVNDVDDKGWTALHYASHCETVDCVKYCIEVGANVNARNNLGYTPLHYASASGPHVKVVRVLLDAGALVDATGIDDWTPLYVGILNEHVEVTRLLIDRGGKLSNVVLDEYLTTIPDWIPAFIESRSRCQFVSIAIIGIHKYHRTKVTGNNDINVIKLISKHIWSMRMDDGWVSPPTETETKEQLIEEQ
jgi:ankyrin repeat protein